MALVTKQFTSTQDESVEYNITFKTLPPLTNWKYKTFILEILLPMSGVMFDSSADTSDDIFKDKKTTWQDLFAHLSKMISDPRVLTLFEDMLKGATYEDPNTYESKPLIMDKFFDDEIALMDQVFMSLLEVNFSHLFTKNGILQLLQNQTMSMVLTAD